MSAKNRATGNTEDDFQAALATYTRAGNKTAAMRRLWNAAYEMGRLAAEAAASAVLAVEKAKVELAKEKTSKGMEQSRQTGFSEGRQAGFEEGRQIGEKLSFAAGRTAGLAMGMDLGREKEHQRWKDSGHFEDGMCRAFDDTRVIPVEPSPPRQSLSPNTSTDIATVFNWADDVDSLPIHTVLSSARQPRDFSGLRSSSTNPFDTLQRRHARYHGAHTRSRRPRRQQFHSTEIYTGTRIDSPQSTRPSLSLAIHSKPATNGHLSLFGHLAQFWMGQYTPLRGCVLLGLGIEGRRQRGRCLVEGGQMW